MYLMLSVMHLLHYRHQIGDSLGVLSCSVYQVIGPISFRLWEVHLKKKRAKPGRCGIVIHAVGRDSMLFFFSLLLLSPITVKIQLSALF